MELNTYHDTASDTAVYPHKGECGIDSLSYTVLGLVGEAGELANKFKKHIRNNTPVDREVLADELGDVLWYVAAVATELDINLEDVARGNLLKLKSRAEKNQLTNHS